MLQLKFFRFCLCLLFSFIHLSYIAAQQKDAFVKATVNKTSCVINEPLLVTYQFFTRLNGSANVSSLPSFTGCSVQELAGETTLPVIEMLNGLAYKCYTIRKVQVYPLHAGALILGEATVECNIPGKPAMTIKSNIAKVEVSHLPANGKPDNNTSAVGSFSIQASVAKLNDTAQENNSLQITISGEGCFQQVECPTIQWPKEIDAFDGTTNDLVNKFTYPANGSKVFTIPFVTKQQGSITIPAIQFSYYDMYAHAYKTVSTKPINVQVAPANSHAEAVPMHGNEANYQYVWIVGVIAVVASISLWLYLRKDSTTKQQAMIIAAEERIATVAAQEPSSIVIEENVMSSNKLQALLLTENDADFFALAKQLCEEYKTQTTDNTQQAVCNQLITQCNEALYAGAFIDKDEVLKKLEKILA
jgi:hypothetical protein